MTSQLLARATERAHAIKEHDEAEGRRLAERYDTIASLAESRGGPTPRELRVLETAVLVSARRCVRSIARWNRLRRAADRARTFERMNEELWATAQVLAARAVGR